MADQIVEEKILFRFSKLIKDGAIPLENPRSTTISSGWALRDVSELMLNDPDVTVSFSIIPKNSLLNVNSI
jgi:hypothetical protein